MYDKMAALHVVAYDIEEVDDWITVVDTDHVKPFKSDNVKDVLNYLAFSTSNAIRVMWDVDYSFSIVQHKMPMEILEKMTGEDVEDVYFRGYSIFCPRKQMIRISKAKFYGLCKFFNQMTDDAPALAEVKHMAEEAIETLGSLGITGIRKLTSPIAVFDDSPMGRAFYENVPNYHDLLNEGMAPVLEPSSAADRKDWVDSHYVGHFKANEIFDYDLSRCYAWLASRLPDTRDLTMIESREYGELERGALLGVVKGKMYLNPKAKYAHCSPILTVIDKTPTNCLGNLPEACYTLDELRLVEDNRLGSFELTCGWFFYPNTDDVRYPFKQTEEWLYSQKDITPLAGYITKSIGNSIVGNLIEKPHGPKAYGSARNDFYHCQISAGCRVAVAQFLIDNDIKAGELVAVQTDGCRLTRKVELEGAGMGKWRYNESTDNVLIVNPRRVYVGDKKPSGATYAEIVELINEHPRQERYYKPVKRRITLGQALFDYKDIALVGSKKEVDGGISLIALDRQQLREFDKLPTTGRKLLNNKYGSKPIVLK